MILTLRQAHQALLRTMLAHPEVCDQATVQPYGQTELMTCLLDVLGNAMPGAKFARMSWMARELATNRLSGPVGWVFFVQKGQMCLTHEGVSSLDAIRRRVRTHAFYVEHEPKITLEFQPLTILPGRSGAADEIVVARKYWEEELRAMRALALGKLTPPCASQAVLARL